MSLSLAQLVEVLETPLGNYDQYDDVEVVKHRRKIHQWYGEYKKTMSFSDASRLARVAWIYEQRDYGEIQW